MILWNGSLEIRNLSVDVLMMKLRCITVLVMLGDILTHIYKNKPYIEMNAAMDLIYLYSLHNCAVNT